MILELENLDLLMQPIIPLALEKLRSKNYKLDAEGLVLGLQQDAEYCCGEIKLNVNDLILYYTDGVIDTSNF